MGASVTKLGESLPADFVASRKRQRIVRALAELIVEKGYEQAKIGDIVHRAGVARKTLYDNFEGKAAIAQTLVAPVLPAEAAETALWLVVVELAARWEAAGNLADSNGQAEDVLAILWALPGSVAPPTDGGQKELNCTLPPGRHGLPRDFVIKNQRHRLLTGAALAIVENGYSGTTIAHITRHAAVSRRTFYEHFSNREAAFAALVSAASDFDLGGLRSGVRALAIEIVATAATNEVAASRRAKDTARIIQRLVEHFAQEETQVAA